MQLVPLQLENVRAETSMAIDIGIETEVQKKIAGALGQVLGNTQGLYLKTHGYHWNVEGPMFNTLHLMFETQDNAHGCR